MFKGTTKECLAHIVQEQGHETVRRALLAYTSASRKAVSDWLKEKSSPLSLHFIKVRSFLQRAGYTVTDYEALPPELKKLSDLLGRGVITPEQANEALGYHDQYEVIRLVSTRGRHVMKSRRVAIEKLYRDALRERTKQERSQTDLSIPATDREIAGSAPTRDTILPEMFLGMKSFVALTVPIAEEMLQASPEDRQRFRQEVGTKRLFDFSNNLHRFSQIVNALCSEKAREVAGVNNSKLTKKEG